CDITDSTWIEARVSDIIIDTVFGLTDPTKIITFQAKDQHGNDITHFLNQQTMKLSQHYGITKTFDLYFVPSVEMNDSSVYYLAGKSHPVLGVQNLTWQAVYNYDVGDEFHHYTYYTGEGGPITKSMQRVISKQDFGNDSVKYIMDNCGVTLYSGGWRAPSYTRYSLYGRYQAQEYDTFRYGRSYSCWNDAFEPDHTISDYAAGLGETYYFWQQWYNWPVEMTNELVYCKKGSSTYGSPLAPDCDVLLKINEQREKEIKISVNPNPVDTRAEVILANTGQSALYYFLTNSYSKQVLSGEVISNSFILYRSNLPAGLYILTIRDKNNNLLGRKKILFE
ncbi:MAG: T9SS type A sorting domain-containing protein, partial [Bacteroidales bacterium]